MKKKIIYIVLIIIFICLYIVYRNNNLVFISKDDKEQLMEILEINEGTTFKPIYIKYISSGIHGSDPHYFEIKFEISIHDYEENKLEYYEESYYDILVDCTHKEKKDENTYIL